MGGEGIGLGGVLLSELWSQMQVRVVVVVVELNLDSKGRNLQLCNHGFGGWSIERIKMDCNLCSRAR